MLRLSTTALVMFGLSCPDQVDAAGGAKVFIWRKAGSVRRVTLPSQKGDPATLQVGHSFSLANVLFLM